MDRLLSIDQPVPEIWQVKHLKEMTLKVKVDRPHFQWGSERSQDTHYVRGQAQILRKLVSLIPK